MEWNTVFNFLVAATKKLLKLIWGPWNARNGTLHSILWLQQSRPYKKLLKLIWDPWNTRTTRSYWRMEYHIQFLILCPMKAMQEGGAQITLAE